MASESNTVTVPVRGMHCASCASVIGKRLKKMQGVTDVSASFTTEQATISFDPAISSLSRLSEAIEPLGYSLVLPHDERSGVIDATKPPKNDQNEHEDREYADMQLVFPFSLFVFVLMMWEIVASKVQWVPPVPFPMSFLSLILFVLATIVLVGPGLRFVRAVGASFRYRVASMDTLIGIGIIVAYTYSLVRTIFPHTMASWGFDNTVYFDVTIVVVGFVQFGKYLEARSKRKTGEALQKLMRLQAKTALVVRGTQEIEVPVESVNAGDIVRVKPGSSIPLDGEVVSGESAINESMVTGESLPVDVKKGSRVIGATMNMYGSITVRITREVGDTVLSRIVSLVTQAQNSKATIEKLADSISAVFVPAVLFIAVLSFFAWVAIGSAFMPVARALVYAMSASVGVLVIACPCALGLATPTAIIVAVGRAAGLGILVKDSESLEKLHRVTTVVMDKTGTLTYGEPVVTDIIPEMEGKDYELMHILASLERLSEHPLAHAVAAYAKDHEIEPEEVSSFAAVGGRGVRGVIRGVQYAAGNLSYMNELSIPVASDKNSVQTKEGKTPLYVAKKRTLLGVVYVADRVKEGAAESVRSLKKLGIDVIMATGDDRATAEYIAKQTGISRVEANIDPEKKYTLVKSLQRNGQVVAMVGDGINDAPALAASDVGIAMSSGVDIAISTAHMTLLHGDITKITRAIILSKKTMRVVKENLFWAFLYNIVGIPLAAGLLYPLTGALLSPVFAGLAMAGSSVSVVANSLRLRHTRI